MKNIQKSIIILCTSLCILASTLLPANAAMQIDIYGPGQNIVNLALATPLTEADTPAKDLGAKLAKAISTNLHFLPFMRITKPAAILGGSVLKGAQPPDIDFKRFQLAGADLLITAKWPEGDDSGSNVELRLYETYSGQFVFGNAYSDVQEEIIWDVADRFCADLMEALTGRGDFFRSTLAFVKTGSAKHQKDIWTAKPTGRDLKQITRIKGTSLSPSWSMDGRFIVFSHIDDSSHALGVWDSTSKKVQRIRFPGNTVIGPVFMPNNNVAVSLSTGNNPDIFMLNHSFQRERSLEETAAINVSPSFDATGSRMAFTSSRLGGPQVFIKDFKKNTVTRVSKNGGYNTEPSISPDGTLITFSRLTKNGHRIFVQDLITGIERQVTFGPGSDEQPSFAPDSYFIAFTSSRGGRTQIYLTTRHGGDPKKIPTGSGAASFPRWGTIPNSK